MDDEQWSHALAVFEGRAKKIGRLSPTHPERVSTRKRTSSTAPKNPDGINVVSTSLTDAQFDAMIAAAAKAGVNRAQFARDAILARLESSQ